MTRSRVTVQPQRGGSGVLLLLILGVVAALVVAHSGPDPRGTVSDRLSYSAGTTQLYQLTIHLDNGGTTVVPVSQGEYLLCLPGDAYPACVGR